LNQKLSKQIDTPEGFFAAIPQDLRENLQYRMNLHDKLEKDPGMQKAYLELCWADLRILFNTAFWVFDTQDTKGNRNKPFILWPHQEKAVEKIHQSIIEQKDLAINKSRKEGATEIICKAFAGHFLLDPESNFLVGSRKAEYVDKGVEIVNGAVHGLHKTLMHKICYAIMTLPRWMRPNVVKTYMLLQNLDNGATISGEATNENFGAGDRQNAILIDEDSVHDTSECIIVNSTHFWGPEHPYNQLLTQRYGKIEVCKLPWWENPTKNKGLYMSPKYDVIEIEDIDYYRELCPEVFNNIERREPFVLSKLERDNITEKWADKLSSIKFVADGGDLNDGNWRSPWYDKEESERRPSDVARNLNMTPRGSDVSVFTTSTLRKIEVKTVLPPKYHGDLKVIYKDGKVVAGKFVPGAHKKLLWWGELEKGRPKQDHNYIVGCDISLGRGSSNSVASIVDVNTREEVGKWVDSSTPPESFADAVVALCKWIGGKDKFPLLIWESNGPGLVFGDKVLRNKYPFVYVQRDEKARRKKKKNRYGWVNTKGPDGSKFHLCVSLDAALTEGVSDKPEGKYIITHDINVVNEAEGYVFNSSGTPCVTKSLEDDDTSASATHGDRVIALGLCNLALAYQPAALVEVQKKINKNTIGGRMLQRKRELQKKKLHQRFIF